METQIYNRLINQFSKQVLNKTDKERDDHQRPEPADRGAKQHHAVNLKTRDQKSYQPN